MAMKKSSPDRNSPSILSKRATPAPVEVDEARAKAAAHAERLEEIRSLLATGAYRISSDQIADKLMERMSGGSDREKPVRVQ